MSSPKDRRLDRLGAEIFGFIPVTRTCVRGGVKTEIKTKNFKFNEEKRSFSSLRSSEQKNIVVLTVVSTTI